MKKGFLLIAIFSLLLMVSGCQTSVDGKGVGGEEKDEQNGLTTVELAGHPETPDGGNGENSEHENSVEGQQQKEESPPSIQKYDYAPEFSYPEAGVMGIYMTANTAGGARFQDLMQFLDETALNAVVIDLKDDHGFITVAVEGDGLVAQNSRPTFDPKMVLTTLKEHEVYPIARIVAFKDTELALKRPELSFQVDGQVWKNRRGEAFINPFLKETWEYNIEVAKLAAKMGFKEVQFDYVRFPEGFETRDQELIYALGEYAEKMPHQFMELEAGYDEAKQEYTEQLLKLELLSMQWKERLKRLPVESEEYQQAMDRIQELASALAQLRQQEPQPPTFTEKERLVQLRVDAVTDFVAYARQELAPYDVHVSVDIFGYSATVPEAPGIGQNFSRISQEVDVISSMIYPSHWGTSYFGVDYPDLHPYELVTEYAKVENQVLAALGDKRPISRPWIQDFTASYLPRGTYQVYGKEQIEAQIRALQEQGITEFLLWDPTNRFTRGVNYTPLN